MAAINHRISDKVRGDAIPVVRDYLVPAGLTAAKIYWAIKVNEDDPDFFAGSLLISITAVASSAGQITVPTTTNGVISCRLRMSPAQSLSLEAGVDYYYAIKMILATGDPHTLENGRMELGESIVDANV